MAQKLGLDIGGKRTGIALTDTSNIIASGLKTVETTTLLTEVKQIMSSYDIDVIVLGKPTNLDGSATDASHIVEKQAHLLKLEFPNVAIEFVDERFTSKIAKQAILFSGARKKQRRDKALIDQVSASIILQTYLDLQS